MNGNIDKILNRIKRSPTNVRFSDLSRICEHFFGGPRKQSGSHRTYRTPWIGDPRINIQNHNGKAKVYQVKQVLAAIEKLENMNEFKR